MSRRHIPQEILDAAHARSAARAAGDWAEADRLRETIEAAGWVIVDRGTDFSLTPSAPADAVVNERIRYGASANVPSRAAEPDNGIATVVLVARERPHDLARTMAALQAGSPATTTIVVVADGPSPEQAEALEAVEALPTGDTLEVVWTVRALGDAAAMNIGIRRSVGAVVILLDTQAEVTGDIVTPLARALGDPTVAVAGGWGTTSADLRRFEAAPPGDVDAIDLVCQAFRRADALARGPLDERFRTADHLATWWSLVLRDNGEGVTPGRAVAIADLPFVLHDVPRADPPAEPAQPRDEKRDRYRIIDRFGWRRDLLTKG